MSDDRPPMAVDPDGGLEQLYNAYRDELFRIANGILRNPFDAEDAVHDVFTRLARDLSGVTELDSPRTKGYLAILTEHQALDLLRKRRIRTAEELTGQEPDHHHPPPGEPSLLGCIAALSPRERECVLLRDCYGYSLGEIARILNLSYDAAAKIHQRGKKKLLELCRKEGIL